MKKDKTNTLICFWNTIGIAIIAGFLLYGLIVGGSASLGYCEDNTYFWGTTVNIRKFLNLFIR